MYTSQQVRCVDIWDKSNRKVVMEMKTLVNLDFDGVLIPNNFEKKLMGTDGWRITVNEYIKMVNTSPLAPLNYPLLNWFAKRMDKYAIRLWTNRNSELRERTLENLGPFKSLFDSFHFYSGEKIDSQVEGIIIDNNFKYLHCGELDGLLYEFTQRGGVQ